MLQMIDCLFIGHNEMQFSQYEKMVRSMGTKNEAYRDLNLNFIKHKDRLYTAPEIFNELFYEENSDSFGPLGLSDTFSAAIAYLGTYIYRRGFTFDYVNSFQNEKEALIEKLEKNNIRLIAIPTTLYVSAFPIIEIVNFVRKHNSTARIAVGGPFVSTNIRTQDGASLEYVLTSLGADYYINSSQGEYALTEILGCLRDSKDIANVKNIYYKSLGKYVATEVEPENNKLGENMVEWKLFEDRLGSFAAVRTAISCPFSCSFCGFPQHAGKYQTTEVAEVERELSSLNSIGKVKSVNFIDDTFNVPPERFKEILRMMIKNKYDFKWHSYFRCQFADREMIELMKESGCEGVFLGIESGNQEILQNMNKAATLDKYRKGIEMLRENGIVTFASFIVGFPGETEQTVRDTISFIEETKPDFYRAQLWYCEPITPIWKEKDKYGIRGSQFKWSHSTMDSQKGCELIDEMFLTVKNSIWLSQYNFDFVNIFHLMHRGLSLEQVKEFIGAFDEGMKDRLRKPEQEGTRLEIIDVMNRACKALAAAEDTTIENIEEKYDADFDF